MAREQSQELQNIAPLKRIKMAAASLKDAVESENTDLGINLQLGFTMAPLVGLTTSQAITALNKFAQALGNFKEDRVAKMILDLTVENPVQTRIVEGAQKAFNAKLELAGEGASIETATPSQVKAVENSTKVQKATGGLQE